MSGLNSPSQVPKRPIPAPRTGRPLSGVVKPPRPALPSKRYVVDVFASIGDRLTDCQSSVESLTELVEEEEGEDETLVPPNGNTIIEEEAEDDQAYEPMEPEPVVVPARKTAPVRPSPLAKSSKPPSRPSKPKPSRPLSGMRKAPAPPMGAVGKLKQVSEEPVAPAPASTPPARPSKPKPRPVSGVVKVGKTGPPRAKALSMVGEEEEEEPETKETVAPARTPPQRPSKPKPRPVSGVTRAPPKRPPKSAALSTLSEGPVIEEENDEEQREVIEEAKAVTAAASADPDEDDTDTEFVETTEDGAVRLVRPAPPRPPPPSHHPPSAKSTLQRSESAPDENTSTSGASLSPAPTSRKRFSR